MQARAAIFIHVGAEATQEQQERYALKHCEKRGYTCDTIAFHPEDALKLVKTGRVDVIVCAYLPADRADVAELVTMAGGRLEEARRRGLRAQASRVALALFDRGMTVAEIAELTETPSGQVRAELLRQGRQVADEPPNGSRPAAQRDGDRPNG